MQTVIYIPDELKRKTKAKAALESISMSGLITALLRLWLENKIPTPKIKKEKKAIQKKGGK